MNIKKTKRIIYSREIYLVDGVIRLSNNWGLQHSYYNNIKLMYD